MNIVVGVVVVKLNLASLRPAGRRPTPFPFFKPNKVKVKLKHQYQKGKTKTEPRTTASRDKAGRSKAGRGKAAHGKAGSDRQWHCGLSLLDRSRFSRFNSW